MSVNRGQIIVAAIMTVFLLLVQQTTAASDEDGSCSVCDCLVNVMDTLDILIDRRIEASLRRELLQLDECATGLHTCDDNADCTDTTGSFLCTCQPGYLGDGTTCTDVDECDTGADNCDDNADCTNTDGSFTCQCRDGFEGDGETCTDINECDTGADNCDDNADCANTDGGFTCQCRDGFEGDGGTCTDINECDTGTDNCDVNADCTNTDGGFTCQCRAGFEGDGETCTVAWPDGTYTLLQAVDGCPTVSGPWATGSVFQDTENDPDEPNSVVPANIAEFLRIEVGTDITTHYCTKTTPGSSGVSWPSGSYCIARQGGSCSSGFQEGFIEWDGEFGGGSNSREGVVPDGNYGSVLTLVQFCCRIDGDPNVDIVLPPTEPFGLYRFGGTCQSVQGMNVMEFFITFQTEDDSINFDRCDETSGPDTTGCSESRDFGVTMISIYVCYYNPL